MADPEETQERGDQPTEAFASSLTGRLRERFGADVDPGITLRTEALEGPAPLSSEVVLRLSGRAGAFGRYQLKEELARGGQGAVFRVWDEDLRRDLAMKLLIEAGAEPETATAATDVDPKTLGRFLEEAQVSGQLDHPAIVPVHEIGLDDEGRVYFTMKLVRGRDLATVFEELHRNEGGWTRTRVVGFLLKVCEAMAYAHHKGVVHRDLKPANVMVGRFGAVYVMDWGIARVLDRVDSHDVRLQPDELPPTLEFQSERREAAKSAGAYQLLTMDGDVVGTPTYMSPEQARGLLEEIGPGTDVYAVGAILYHLLAGHPPYLPPGSSANGLAIWSRVQEGPPTPIAQVAPEAPAELVAICEKAMARDVSKRYERMEAMAEDLQAYLEGRVVHAFEAGAVAELRKWVRRNRGLAASILAAVVLAVAGLAAVGLVERRGRRLADEQRAIAVANEERAVASETRAVRQADDLLSLSALQVLGELTEEADELWPAAPQRIDAFEDWLRRADELVAQIPRHEAQRDAIRARGREVPSTSADGGRAGDDSLAGELRLADLRIEQYEALRASGLESLVGLGELEARIALERERVARLRDALAGESVWEFDDPEDRWWHAQLTELLSGLRSFSDEVVGLVDGIDAAHGWGVRRRLEYARSIEERSVASEDARRRWDEAVASIANTAECPAYAGLRLEPQVGLLPIGRDPSSGLWEFWHLQSGEEPRRSADGELVVEPSMGVVLVLVPGGEFFMGAQAASGAQPGYDPRARNDELPVHEVQLSPFFVSKYELTQAQLVAAAGLNTSNYGPHNWVENFHIDGRAADGAHPAEGLTWVDAAQVTSWLGLALPTEAQWEYAARAGSTTPWWTGAAKESLEFAANLADSWAAETDHGATWATIEPWLRDGWVLHAPVGSFDANGFGLHDVAGNVWEWCADGYSSYEAGRVVDPEPETEVREVIQRGGSWFDNADLARSALRGFALREESTPTVGVRPARAVSP